MTHPAPEQRKNPLHGVTLERMLTKLVDYLGWERMADRIPVRCFMSEPSIKSSLTFLRKTPWAREKVEGMYLYMLRDKAPAARE
ncbi:MAG: VF530 family protein [Gemmatimonadaceae bacterium]